MTVDRIVHLVVGTVVLLSALLAHLSDPSWIWLTIAVGAVLAQSGITGFCPMSFMLRKAGVKDGSCCS